MRASRFTEEEIIGMLKEQEAGAKTADVCRKHGISSATLYKFKAKYGGMEVSDARRLKALEEENARLKKLLAEQMLDNAIQHDPIIDEFLFNDVQRILAANRANRERGTNADTPSLLAGLIFDAEGNRRTPTHASRNGVRYRHYVSQTLITAKAGEADRDRAAAASWAGKGQRLPAAGIERLVVDRLHQLLSAPTGLLAIAQRHGAFPPGPAVDFEATGQHTLLEAAQRQALSIGASDAETIRVFLLAVITGIDVHGERIGVRVSWRRLLWQLLGDQSASIPRFSGAVDDAPVCGDQSGLPGTAAAPNAGRPTTFGNDAVDEIILRIPIALKRAGIGLRLVVPGSTSASPPDETLVRIVAKAHQIRDRLFAEPELTVPMLAEREGVTQSYITRLLRLAFLAPDIVMAMLEGRQPVELTANKLLADTRLPIAWAEQRQALGFK